jgi:hypothetical protein
MLKLTYEHLQLQTAFWDYTPRPLLEWGGKEGAEKKRDPKRGGNGCREGRKGGMQGALKDQCKGAPRTVIGPGFAWPRLKPSLNDFLLTLNEFS